MRQRQWLVFTLVGCRTGHLVSLFPPYGLIIEIAGTGDCLLADIYYLPAKEYIAMTPLAQCIACLYRDPHAFLCVAEVPAFLQLQILE